VGPTALAEAKKNSGVNQSRDVATIFKTAGFPVSGYAAGILMVGGDIYSRMPLKIYQMVEAFTF
jgi:hypothetical protein